MPTKHTETFEKITIKEYLKTRDDIDHNDITYPDSPDCIAKLKNGQSVWIEVRSVYRHDKLAKSLNSEEIGQIFSERIGDKKEFQNNYIEGIKRAIIEKDNKSSYEKEKTAYGKGVLLLYIDDPLGDYENIDAVLNYSNYSNKPLRNFSSVYLYIRPTYSSCSNGEMVIRSGIHMLMQSK